MLVEVVVVSSTSAVRVIGPQCCKALFERPGLRGKSAIPVRVKRKTNIHARIDSNTAAPPATRPVFVVLSSPSEVSSPRIASLEATAAPVASSMNAEMLAAAVVASDSGKVPCVEGGVGTTEVVGEVEMLRLVDLPGRCWVESSFRRMGGDPAGRAPWRAASTEES